MKKFSMQDQEALLDVLRRHEQELMAYRGVHYVDVGYKFENGKPTDELAIRVHVGEKKLESELQPSQVLPHTIDGIPVDVIQSNPGLEQNRDARFDPLVGGIAVRNTRHNFFGTLGSVVFDATSLVPMVLSNHHVLVGAGGQAGDNVAQPVSANPADVIGTLTRWNLNLDCAVSTLNNSRQILGGSVGIPQGVGGAGQPVVGMAVTKSGRTTGITFGIVDGVSTDEFTIIPDPQNLPPNGEISSGGDSGSVWLDVGTNNAVGLHFAGETDPNPNAERAWAKRMVNVVTALNIVFFIPPGLPTGPTAQGDDMQPGEVLTPEQSITSANGQYTFIYQGDGNLVLYRNRDGVPLWASNTSGRPTGVCIMQDDGNLVIYDSSISPIWASNTLDAGNRLVVQDDGNTVIYRPDGTPVWATNTVQPIFPTGPTAQGDDMQPGEVLNSGQSITSANGQYTFIYQDDGNLVLYRNRDGVPLWASNTSGRPTGVCIMQDDGNLVIYDSSISPIWASNTLDAGNRLVVQDDGNTVIYRPDGTPVWATNTVQPIFPTGPTAQGDDMQPGEVLTPEQSITSANGQYTFIYQGDGNLVLYRNRDGVPLWASNTSGRPTGVCIMQDDGNLVIYDSSISPIWASNTLDAGNRLVVQDDGNTVIYRPDGTPVWATNTVQPIFPTGPTAQGDDMQPGEVLNSGQSITSANGQYTFIYQDDGNLVLYRNRDGVPLWASNTSGRPTGVCIMQDDGNLVIYDSSISPIWASNTLDAGNRLVVQDDGNTVIYRPDGTPVWATNTVQP